MALYDPEHHHRRSVRFKDHDYAQPGIYFVTICTHHRACVLGEIVGDHVRPSARGECADACWRDIPAHFPGVVLDAYVIMPNHIHGILVIHAGSPKDTVSSAGATFGAPQVGGLGTIVAAFKSATTRRVNLAMQTPGSPLWQRGYYEHIVRKTNHAALERELSSIREYIYRNPIQWTVDRDNSVTW